MAMPTTTRNFSRIPITTQNMKTILRGTIRVAGSCDPGRNGDILTGGEAAYTASASSRRSQGDEPGIREPRAMDPVDLRFGAEHHAERGDLAAPGGGECGHGLGKLGEDLARLDRAARAVEEDREQVEVRERSLAGRERRPGVLE